MSHRSDGAEQWALALLQQIINRSNRERDALPGKCVHHVKEAKKILAKHQERKKKVPRKPIKE